MHRKVTLLACLLAHMAGSASAAALDGRGLNDLKPQARAVFARVYGSEISVDRTIDGRPDSNTYTYSPRTLLETRTGFFLIANAENASGCHACSSGIAVTGLAKADGKPGDVISTLPLVEGGTGSQTLPDLIMESRLLTEPAIRVQGGWGGQGCASTGFTLVSLSVDGPHQTSDFIPLSWRIKDSLLAPEDIRAHFDKVQPGQQFRVTYSGWKMVRGRKIPYRRAVIFRMTNGKFRPIVMSSAIAAKQKRCASALRQLRHTPRPFPTKRSFR